MTGRGAPAHLAGLLATVVGPAHVLTGGDTAGYDTDWTRRFGGPTPAVVRPGSTDEVAAVVRLCRDEGLALTLQGGNTGLVGGSVPLHGEIVLSLRRLRHRPVVDVAAGQVTASAGTTVGDLQRATAGTGWAYGVDLASRDSATVGGTVATNAGGLRMVRHGDTRAQLLGVEAVLGTGAVVSHLGGLLKDNTGYHLPSLLAGSEGTLGVVTRARLRLVPARHDPVVALAAFDDVASAVAAAADARRSVVLEAAELMLADGVELVCRQTGVPPPFTRPHRALVLLEVDGSGSGSGGGAASLEAFLGSAGGVADVAVALDPGPAARLWRYREAHTEAIATRGVPHKMDVTLPAGTLAAFVDEVPAVVAAVTPGAETWLFGHAADGNCHVNVTGVDPGDEAVDDAVLRLAASLGGSISAEHGIGTAKRRWLHLNRSPAELEAFAALRRALNPDGVLNPYVLLPG